MSRREDCRLCERKMREREEEEEEVELLHWPVVEAPATAGWQAKTECG